jgi:hypothetical protein
VRFENNALMNIIHVDVIRTRRNLTQLPPAGLPGVACDPSSPLSLFMLHVRRLERILYVASSINPSICYTQGFNELVMPFYTIFVRSSSLFSDPVEIEALSFRCRHAILSREDFGDPFLMHSHSALLLNSLRHLEDILRLHVKPVYKILRRNQIGPILYAYRWIALLFCQELEMQLLQQVCPPRSGSRTKVGNRACFETTTS